MVWLSAWLYTEQVKPGLSTCIVVALEVPAKGFNDQLIEITKLETPSQLNELAEPVPVPNVKLFTTLATGKIPELVSVPSYTLVKLAFGT